MKTWRLVVLLSLCSVTAWAQGDRPVVQIQGREPDRNPRPTAVTPQAVQMESAMPGAERAPAPRVPGMVAPGPALVAVPVGGIVAWVNAMTNTPALAAGWMECNGQLVEDPQSPYYGQSLPDLNGTTGGDSRFLRGAKYSGSVGGSVSHDHGGYRSQKYGTQRIPVGGPGPAVHLPPYYDVVWIIRVK